MTSTPNDPNSLLPSQRQSACSNWPPIILYFTKRSDGLGQHKAGTVAITRMQDGAPEPDLDPKAAYDPMRSSALLNNWNAIVPHRQVTHAHVLLYCTNYTFKSEQK